MRFAARTGFAPAHNGTVSMCVMNKIGLASFRVPGKFTIKLPVCVGAGIRVFASSKRIAAAGTPASFSAA